MTASDEADTDRLDATATATVSNDSAVVVTLTLENSAAAPVECTFRDGQRIEAVAERVKGSDTDDDWVECWRYGGDRMFSMAGGTETVGSGETVSFGATWPDPGSGDYRVRVWLVSTEGTAADTVSVVVD